jgi:hypothetical protein
LVATHALILDVMVHRRNCRFCPGGLVPRSVFGKGSIVAIGVAVGGIVTLGGGARLDAMQVLAPPTGQGGAAFVHVNVVTMEDTNQVLDDQTVVVRDGRIVALGSAATIAVPMGAARIDGRGKFLIPGLADMHAHVGFSGAPAEKAALAQD